MTKLGRDRRKVRRMTTFKSDFLSVLSERGFIHQISDAEELDRVCATETLTAYVGYDCTAPSLHIGHLVSMMMLRWLQVTGHRPIPLMGGGTTMVGDPSGKDEARQILSRERIEANKATIRGVFDNFIAYGDGPTDAPEVDNAEWLLDLNYVAFLRDVGRHFSVNRMLSFDSVKLRLDREQPLSFLEFNYMILQAYDFVELHRRYGCRLQMGGSDQWGNIVGGIDLGRRTDGAELFALTTHLITTASGAKMGKTAAGAVWLNADALSTYDYWQFWRNTEDGDVGRFMRLFTELPLPEIARLEALGGAEINEAKKVLATEATALAHGRGAAEAAAETARRTFEEGEVGAALPTIEMPRQAIETGLGFLEANVRVGLVSSNSEARREIRGGGLRLNDEVVTDERLVLDLSHVTAAGVIKLSRGRKRHALIRLV